MQKHLNYPQFLKMLKNQLNLKYRLLLNYLM
jgi:hypothetical protein